MTIKSTIFKNNRIIDSSLLNEKNLSRKFYLGEFFLLDKENNLFTLGEKIIYLNNLAHLLSISEYYSIFQTVNKKIAIQIDTSSINEENHKQFFLYLILSIDIEIINNNQITENIEKYYQDKNEELNELVSKGPPQIFRAILWRILTKNEFHINFNKQTYETLTKIILHENISKQIGNDIVRTFPNIDMFQTDSSLNKLKSLLENIARYDKELEYTQGMNNIVGFLLMFMGMNEIDTFNFVLNVFNMKSSFFDTLCFKGTNFKSNQRL